MNKKILVTALSFRRSKQAMDLLAAQGFQIIESPYNRALQENEMLELIPGMAAIVAGNDEITAKVIAAGLPTLKIIARSGAGYNTIDVKAAKQGGVVVTNTPGANSKSVADLTMAMILSLARRIPRLNQSLHKGIWEKETGEELGGKILGVVGTGNIGTEVIKRAVAFDMRIIAYNDQICGDLIAKYGVSYSPLTEVIAQSDFLTLHVPAVAETVGMMNQTVFQSMKRTAYLINTARGELVVENDLCDALEQGKIAGAALDTFAVEPLTESRLHSFDNVILTPHIGANTFEASERVGIMAAREVIQVLSGMAPGHSVN